MSRPTHVSREVKAGCKRCGVKWNGKNAQAIAAKHHDSSGHETWVEVAMYIRYGWSDTQELRLL